MHLEVYNNGIEVIYIFNILVVEDDKNLRKLMMAVLKQNRYNVLSAEDGVQALSILDTVHVDLIISDIMMPNMNGYELTNEIRQADHNIPILMVTAKETFEDKKKGVYCRNRRLYG